MRDGYSGFIDEVFTPFRDEVNLVTTRVALRNSISLEFFAAGHAALIAAFFA